MSKENTGRYGEYGGQYVPDVVMPALKELEDFYGQIKNGRCMISVCRR